MVAARRGLFRRRYDPTSASPGFRAFNSIVLSAMSIFFILPFWLMLSGSLSPEADIARNGFRLIPIEFTVEAYVYLFTSSTQFMRAFFISTTLAVVGTTNTLFWSSMGAYALSRKYLPYRNAMTLFIFITMLFSGGIIPLYLVVRSVGLLNTFFALFIPGSIAAWNLIIIRNYFMALPISLEESAKLDGASDFTVYFRIILPLSKPIMASMVVYLSVGFWNEWYAALIFITSRTEIIPLQLLLRQILTNTTAEVSARGGRRVTQVAQLLPSESLKMAAVMVATIPIIMVYPFLQKHFTKGILIGSIKG